MKLKQMLIVLFKSQNNSKKLKMQNKEENNSRTRNVFNEKNKKMKS